MSSDIAQKKPLGAVSRLGLPKLPDKVENPALQKAEMEWKIEKKISCPSVIDKVP